MALHAGKISMDEKLFLDSLDQGIDKKTITMATIKKSREMYSYVALDVILLLESAEYIINHWSFNLDREIVVYTLREKSRNESLKVRVYEYNNCYYIDGENKISASCVYDTWNKNNKALLDTEIRITYNPSMKSSTILLQLVFYSVLFTKKRMYRNKKDEKNDGCVIFDIDLNTELNYFRGNSMPMIYDALIRYKTYLNDI